MSLVVGITTSSRERFLQNMVGFLVPQGGSNAPQIALFVSHCEGRVRRLLLQGEHIWVTSVKYYVPNMTVFNESWMMLFCVITARGYLPGYRAMYTAGLEKFFGITRSHYDQNHTIRYFLNTLLRPQVFVAHLISDTECLTYWWVGVKGSPSQLPS